MSLPEQKTRKPMDAFAAGIMLLLCLIWGLHQVAIKAASLDMNPILQVGIRSAMSGVLLSLWMWKRREFSELKKNTLWPGIVIALLFAAEFLCVSLGLNYTSASHMSVFLYTAPIFAALGLHFWVAGEKLKWWQWLGVLIAFVGIGLAFSNGFNGNESFSRWILIGDCLGLAAGLFWAATTVYIRFSVLSEAPASVTLLYQLIGATIILLSIAFMKGYTHTYLLTPVVWTSLAFQAVLVAFASFLTWFWMLRIYLASRLSVFSFLSPLFGVAFGVWLLHDTISVRFFAGSILVMIGVIAVNGKGE
jgi:drug/metabolite transporter (DMT)-like permease